MHNTDGTVSVNQICTCEWGCKHWGHQGHILCIVCVSARGLINLWRSLHCAHGGLLKPIVVRVPQYSSVWMFKVKKIK